MGASNTTQTRSITDLRAAGRMVAKEAGGGTVAAFFESNKDTLKAVLPQHISPERIMKIALGALRTTPKLMNATVQSLFGAVVHCAQMGLEPNTPQGHIYLIPFENKRKGVTEVQIITGYKGLVDLARRSGQIVSISARTRCQRDEWDMELGTEDRITHRPAEGDRGPVIGFYAVAKLKDGGVQFEYMSLAEVQDVRNGSQGYKTAQRFGKTDSPWIAHFDEMGRKTVIRRLCKYLPMSIELAHAVVLDERAEAGRVQGLDGVLDGADYSVMPEDDADAAAALARDVIAGLDNADAIGGADGVDGWIKHLREMPDLPTELQQQVDVAEQAARHRLGKTAPGDQPSAGETA